ncbi:death domain-associated protein 6 isoform X2 [Alosa sapidissima]|uniref:death domain-associated protein 6 isoform X2 n=1 Tax=Alosa sapidissima TaxID=34773 RepID=UPI001C086400|nr:death domain-associated protein 6 isoform X2 [Alosa sapidissima]
MENIIILDDDEEEEKSEPSSSTNSRSSADKPRRNVQAPTPTHITQSPFASAKKNRSVLQKENEKLFAEFVEHCRPHTIDCPEVLTFLQTKHAKATPDFLSSVEFRNTLGRCLTRAQASAAKTFVFINELCTVLKQHSAKRRSTTHTLPPAEEKAQRKTEGDADGDGGSLAEATPSTSGAQGEGGNEDGEKKPKRASRRQIAYLENLLKVYNDEIKRLQEKELSVDDLEEEDSSYIQEHKLKRKMMKIYDKLCELKSCSSLTGRVIEQRVSYKGTRYPEINKKIERYINSPEVRLNPPDYRDILQLVQRTNQRHNLSLTRSQLSQIAQDAFQESGSRLQDRRHLDMVFNFGSHLTDTYKPNTDPALTDPTLARKLRSNREVALSSLEEVITKYAMKQGDTEEEERQKRQKANQKKEDSGKVDEEEKGEGSGGEEEEEEEEDEEDDVSSDPDIEEEIQASHSQEGDEEDEENDEPTNASEGENQGSEDLPSVKSSALEEEEDEEGGEEEGTSENDQQSVSSSHREPSTDASPPEQPTTENASPSDSPSQSEPVKTILPMDNQWQSPISPSQPITTNLDSLPPSPVVVSTNEDLLLTPCDTKSINGRSSPPSPVGSDSAWNSRKRRRSVEIVPQKTSSKRQKANSMSGSESDIPLDMGVASSPLQADSTRADSPTQEIVSSSQMTPPTKSNKVDATTQCDPEEVIVLSDSD